MADNDSVEVRAMRSQIGRVKRSLEKAHETADTVSGQTIPDTAEILKAARKQANEVGETSRELLSRYDDHVRKLELLLLELKIDPDEINAEIDPAADFSFDCIRWIKRCEIFAIECEKEMKRRSAAVGNPEGTAAFEMRVPTSEADQQRPVRDQSVRSESPVSGVGMQQAPVFGASMHNLRPEQIPVSGIGSSDTERSPVFGVSSPQAPVFGAGLQTSNLENSPAFGVSGQEAPVFGAGTQQTNFENTPVFGVSGQQAPVFGAGWHTSNPQETPVFSVSGYQAPVFGAAVQSSYAHQSPVSDLSYQQAPVHGANGQNRTARQAPVFGVSFEQAPVYGASAQYANAHQPPVFGGSQYSPVFRAGVQTPNAHQAPVFGASTIQTPVFGVDAGMQNHQNVGPPPARPEPQSPSSQRTMQLLPQQSTETLQYPSAYIGSAAKLPKLTLQKFGGDSSDWRSFWDSFSSSVHDNTTLRPVDKMKYLQAQLFGDALKTITGLCLSNGNYDTAVNLLKSQYGSTDTQIAAIHAKLMQLKPVSDDTKKLRSFYLDVESSLRSLENLGQETQNPHFVSLILAKLPPNLIMLLERNKGPTKPWTVSDLRQSLNAEISVRESTDRYRFKPEQDKPCERKDKRNDDTKVVSGQSLAAAENRRGRAEKPTPNPKCIFCNEAHWSDECHKFETVNARKTKIKGRCYICLSDKHMQRKCMSKKPCFHCKEFGHHSALCFRKFPAGERVWNSTIQGEANSRDQERKTSISLSESASEIEDIEETNCLAFGEQVLLQTAVCKVQNPGGGSHQQVRVLLDCGSNRSYITENLAKSLKVPVKNGETLRVNRFASRKPVDIKTKTAEISLILKNGMTKTLSVNVVPDITGNMSSATVSPEILKRIPKNIKLVNGRSEITATPVELLIGNEYYLEITSGKRINVMEGLFAIETSLGWILSGRLGSTRPAQGGSDTMLHANGGPLIYGGLTSTEFPETPVLKASWEDMCKLETIGIHEDPTISDDDLAVEQFESTISCLNGRYSVSWPWRSNLPDLPSNYGLALGRLKNLMKRLEGRPDLLEKYRAIFNDQEQKGVIEAVDPPPPESRVHYIAHHPVETPQKATTKVRIVYDASAKCGRRNPSLNDCLLRGPVILQDLVNLLMRFRFHKIPLIADIEKAFLQVGLHEPDRDFTRFLWVKDPKQPAARENLQEYRFTRVPFGMTSSPFLLSATVKHHLATESVYKKTAAELKDNLYVDNVVVGCETIEAAKRIYHESKAIFDKASMNLREWMTCDPEVNNFIPEKDRSTSKVSKLLGVVWDSELDQLSVQSPTMPPVEPITKRKVLCFIASVFDPLGFFSPAIIEGKIFFQHLCKEKKSWDEEINSAEESRWREIAENIRSISQTKIQRFPGNISLAKQCFLVCFSDASTKAYATAVYLVIEEAEGWYSNLIFARTRINPIRPVSMPRLELLGALIGVRAIDYIRKKVPLAIDAILFTDSQCVYHWIKSKKTLKNFISRRIQEINSVNASVRYVKTTDNPADIATRGKTMCEIDEFWWKGPSWLRADPETWPTWNIQEISPKTEADIEKEFLKVQPNSAEECLPAVPVTEPPPFGIQLERYSELPKLLRVTAWCSRFRDCVKEKCREKSESLTATEMQDARHLWEMHVQRAEFADILKAVEQNKTHRFSKQFKLFRDQNGLIRCRFRVMFSELNPDAKLPILLPKDHPFTFLVIEQSHKSLKHAGVSQTLLSVRERYWILHGRRQVRKVVTKCLVCRRHEGGPFALPEMPDLPSSRVTKSQPFAHSGVDYFGPVYVKEANTQKTWVCLFTCLTIRAVHLELVSDCTAQQFLLALRRFTARRGRPHTMLSDNAPQFKLVSNITNASWTNVLSSATVKDFLASEGIEWSFITAYAPWMGGVYERMVQTVKRPLRKALGKALLNTDQLSTLLTEVENIVNSRPITYDDGNESVLPLTPNHFLGLVPNEIEVRCHLTEADARENGSLDRKNLVSLWKKSKNCLEQFWKMWEKEYLHYLQQRAGWFHKRPRKSLQAVPKVGDVVIVKTELQPRGSWPIGRILALPPGVDGRIRSAVIKLSSNAEIRRSVGQLYPLEVEDGTAKMPKGDENNEDGTGKMPNVDDNNQNAANEEPVTESQESEDDDEGRVSPEL